jgi:hypothetical protein
MKNKIKWALALFLTLANLFFLVRYFQTREYTVAEETRVTFYVDSVWSKSPGEINTLQTDVIYFGRTRGGEIHSSRSKISLGDSFVYIYRRLR